MKMKPLPKFILLGVVVAGVGYGINAFLDSRKSVTPEPVVATQNVPTPAVVPAPVEVVSAPPPVPTPAPASTDSGLDSVLKAAASKKK